MTTWLPAALLSLLSFGLWGFFSKMAVTYIDSKSALIYQTIGGLIIGLLALSLVNFKPTLELKGFSYAILTGAAYAIGCFLYFFAASKGKAITVVTLTSLYPFITILLAFFLLKETISVKQYAGIFLAFIAIYLMI